MADPLTTFTDAQLGVIELLRAGLPTVGYPTATVHNKTSTSTPHVMVRLDSTDNVYPAAERCTVRITCWHTTEGAALQLAKVCRALVGSTPGTDKIRTTNPLTGPVPAADPDTAAPLATLTVAVHTRPVPA